MNIKTWDDRLAEMEDGAITTSHHVTCAMQDEIDELRAALKTKPTFVQTRAQLENAWCELNAMRAALKAQPEQRPRVYIAFSENGEHISYWTRSLEDAQTWTGRTNKKCEPFYPAPVQPAPLTDEQIQALLPKVTLKGEDPKTQVWLTRKDAIAYARAIEAALKGCVT